MSLPLSGLRSCLLRRLQPGPPVAAQLGQAAITPAAGLADSFGERVTFRGGGELGPLDVAWLGGRDVSVGMLRSRRRTPARGCLRRQPRECNAGLFQLPGMPAVLRSNVEPLPPAPRSAIPALHWQRVLTPQRGQG